MNDTTGTTVQPQTTHNVRILGREFIATGPATYTQFRTWLLEGPNGGMYEVIQHLDPTYRRNVLQPFTPFGGRDLRIKGNAALVEVQPDGTLRGVK